MGVSRFCGNDQLEVLKVLVEYECINFGGPLFKALILLKVVEVVEGHTWELAGFKLVPHSGVEDVLALSIKGSTEAPCV